MNSEEFIAKFGSVNSMEDAYAMAKEDGYTGSMEDFTALCEKCAEGISDKLNLDDMEAVAGGNAFTDTVSETAQNVWNWMKENPYKAAGIGAGAVGAIAAVAVGVHYLNAGTGTTDNTTICTGATPSPVRTSVASSSSSEGGLLLDVGESLV